MALPSEESEDELRSSDEEYEGESSLADTEEEETGKYSFTYRLHVKEIPPKMQISSLDFKIMADQFSNGKTRTPANEKADHLKMWSFVLRTSITEDLLP